MNNWTVYTQAGAAALTFLGAALNLLTALVRRGRRTGRPVPQPEPRQSGRVGKNHREPDNSGTSVIGDRE